MSSVTVVMNVMGSESSFATQDAESLDRLFRIMQKEKLQTPAKADHRLFVRVYTYPAKTISRKIEMA
jgi:hypothetical protein